MVKVKDTATFVERAREVHGDKYDYSHSTWVGANSPIVYKCNKCGKDTQTYTARKHICEKLKQGCGRCYRRRNWDTKEAKEQLKNRPCISCGKPLNSTDIKKVACSKECGHAGRSAGKIIVACNVCGKLVERYKRQFDKYGVASCSLECQRQWALNERHSSQFAEVDWHRKSIKAKRRWKARDTRNRKEKSISYMFWLKCKIPSEISIGAWQRRCTTSAAGLRERFVGNVSVRASIKTWKRCFRANLERLKQKSIRDEREGWEWKVNSVASGVRRRRRIKSLQQGKRNILRHIELRNQQPRQLSFWG